MPLIIQRIIALLILLLSLPLWPILFLLVKLDSPGTFIFKQRRAGLNKKPFTIYKIRTMVENAEKLRHKYKKANEAHGPVFKIRNDPRYTRVGRLIARFAIDELPQLVNILKGEMALVGPRPLPLYEAKRVPQKYIARFSVLPGMTSSWITNGGHTMHFKDWMMLDLDYVKKRNSYRDIRILFKTLILLIDILIKKRRKRE